MYIKMNAGIATKRYKERFLCDGVRFLCEGYIPSVDDEDLYEMLLEEGRLVPYVADKMDVVVEPETDRPVYAYARIQNGTSEIMLSDGSKHMDSIYNSSLVDPADADVYSYGFERNVAHAIVENLIRKELCKYVEDEDRESLEWYAD